MEVKVRFRVNKATGEVEIFEVDDLDSTLPEAEHNREHDRIAAELGAVIERRARVTEHSPGVAISEESHQEGPAKDDSESEKQKAREGKRVT